jgi:hypothetical protein
MALHNTGLGVPYGNNLYKGLASTWEMKVPSPRVGDPEGGEGGEELSPLQTAPWKEAPDRGSGSIPL